ncbi:GntR family transcriptional regulator [Thalassococcus sp. S3]|uniref:GntR family transcriptional regulator n=1 Tax=Thalassococcus sp. S3 TaxID=2017482 RepID=UPI0010242235|nr:GntR family transcriptional regulator [Thalassococcus sp. S3]QBF33201.1 GntR family transcriptional regulator [Thalassococcus sp. S3]
MRDTASVQLPEGGKSRRVYLLLRERISGGIYADGSVLPSEHKLCAEHGVSRVTIRRALDALCQDGLIKKRVGAGSIVRSNRIIDTPLAADMGTLVPQIVRMGEESTARLLSFSYGPAPKTVSSALGLADGARVQTAVRVRDADGAAFSHLTTHVPEKIAQSYSEADLATTPLFQLLERSGVQIGSARQSVTAALASPDVADALGVSVGTALLGLTRVVMDADGSGVEYLSALYRPDMFRLEMSLHRVGDSQDRHWEPITDKDGGG